MSVELSNVIDVATTLALVGGLLFAAFEWRASRQESHRQSQTMVLRSFESPEFVMAMRRIMDLPDGLSRREIEDRLGDDDMDLIWYWMGAMESIGILIFDRVIEIRLVDQTYGGPILVTGNRLRGYVADVRARIGRDSMHEWFQWLAERIEALERDEGRTPAHIRETDWRP